MHDHKGRALIYVTLESVERREAEIESLRSRLAAAELAMRQLVNVGHDDNCILCGFKDRRVDMYFNAFLSAAPVRADVLRTPDDPLSPNYDPSAAPAGEKPIQSCVHCASERISLLTFDVWECEDCGREFTFDWRPASAAPAGALQPDQPAAVTVHVCRAGCVDDGPHQWDGPEWVSEDGSSNSATCSRCGMTAMHHSLMTGP